MPKKTTPPSIQLDGVCKVSEQISSLTKAFDALAKQEVAAVHLLNNAARLISGLVQKLADEDDKQQRQKQWALQMMGTSEMPTVTWNSPTFYLGETDYVERVVVDMPPRHQFDISSFGSAPQFVTDLQRSGTVEITITNPSTTFLLGMFESVMSCEETIFQTPDGEVDIVMYVVDVKQVQGDVAIITGRIIRINR